MIEKRQIAKDMIKCLVYGGFKMTKIQERFMRYVKIDTTSNEHSETVPSTKIQLDLAQVLVEELTQLGLSNVRQEKGYVYATLNSNVDYDCPSVGFIAHMDTAPDFCGKDIKPRIIEQWDGKPIQLNETRVLSVERFEDLVHFVGDDIIVTDGNTLLGADDKAGIAIIMDAIAHLVAHPEIKHGTIQVGFTPDEEVGRGADHFDVASFGADFAFTLDGGMPNEFCYETFNAYKADVVIYGQAIHPGSSKGQMINAISIANEFDRLLPTMMRPEYTEGYEGFNHMYHIEGSVEKAHMEYIIRNHDATIIQEQINDFNQVKDFINQKYRQPLVEVQTKLQYKNMAEYLKNKPELLEIAKDAIASIGLAPETSAARGGTDGSRLTFMGLPCPNLGTGSMNHHGPYECASINKMKEVTQITLAIIDRVVAFKK